MTIGITGMVGFVGSHLRDRLAREEGVTVPAFTDDIFDDMDRLTDYVRQCDTIVHLAAMNRSGDENIIFKVNVELVNKLISAMEAANVKPSVVFSSSTQIDRDNTYGKSKAEGARLLTEWAKRVGAPLTIMVIPNVFGDNGKPFYNSVVATFCHQVTHGEEPKIMVDGELGLIYVNELVELMAQRADTPPEGVDIWRVPPGAQAKVSEILALLNKFKAFFYENGMVPEVNSDFERDLYNTFITYMDEVDWHRNLKLNTDDRGSFVEVFRLENGGQVSFSTTKTGITRGNHYHIRKNEKFCVVSGQASIKLRRIGTDKVIEYKVSGDKPSWVEMPIYYTHNISNIGDMELVTLFWINEHFNPDDPDTFYEEV